MIRSMTGFGESSEQNGGVEYSVELRSLNNKYFKAVIRLPEEIAALEAEFEAVLRKRISRGSLMMIVRMHASDALAAHRVNDSALMVYLDHLEAIHSKVAGQDHAVHIDLTSLLALPGVLGTAEENILQRARPVLLRLTNQVCDRLSAMRVAEGKAINQDLAVQRCTILDRLEIIKKRAPQVVEEYHQRLRTRIDELLARAELKLDERDLIREVAIYGERCDITEEVTRLAAHLEQFEQIVSAPDGEPAGRTLDFLTQELLREANTVASKSNDAMVSRTIVEVKGAIDRIKEQVQNIE